jgi:hypothetical protein
VARLQLDAPEAKRLQAALQQSETLEQVRELLQPRSAALAAAV